MISWCIITCNNRIRLYIVYFFFFQAEDGIRDHCVTGVQTCALPICLPSARSCERPVVCARDLALGKLVQAKGEPFCEIGRASCRERVEISAGGGYIEEKRGERELGVTIVET